MKRLTAILIICCLCLVGCGGAQESADAPATPKPVEYIDIAEAKPLVEEFITSETMAYLQAEFTRQIGSVVQGPWLDWMVGVAMDDLAGEAVDYVIFQLSGDVANEAGIIGEWMTVLYDRNTQTWHDSLTTDFEAWYATRTEGITTREDSRNLLLSINPGAEGSVIYHHEARERWLSKADVAAINAQLGLTKPQPRTEKGQIETVTMDTTDDARLSAVSAAAETFFAGEYWQSAAVDSRMKALESAIEYKNDDMSGFAVHVLLLTAAGVQTDFFSPHFVVDMADGAVYTENDLDMENWDDPHVRTLSAYHTYASGENPDIWGDGEIIVRLTEEELAAVNAPFAEAMLAQQAEREEQIAAAEATMTDGMQSQLLALACEYQQSDLYQLVAADPSVLRLSAAAEYTLEDLEGYNIHVLLLVCESVDAEHYGLMASMALMDLTTGRVYTEQDLDMENWGDLARLEHAFAAVLGGYEYALATGENIIWSEDGVLTPVSSEDIAAVNAALNP